MKMKTCFKARKGSFNLGAIHYGNVLRYNRSIKRMNLSCNRFGPDCSAILGEGYIHFQTLLTQVNLNLSILQTKSLNLEGAKYNDRIFYVDLRLTGCDPEIDRSLQNVLKRNRQRRVSGP